MTALSAAAGISVTPNNQHEGRRAYHALDAWRGLASLWVVCYHASLSLSSLPGGGARPVPLWLQGGYLGVPLFFVISGYCIANAAVSAARREHSAKVFFLARLRRIYPPYLTVLLLSLAAGALLSPRHSWDALLFHPLFWLSSLTLTQFLLHQSFTQPIFWTLNYEVAFYALTGALLFLPARLCSPRVLLNALHGLSLLAVALLVLLPHPPPFPLDFWAQFGLGALAFDIVRHPQARFPRWALAAAGLGLAAFALTHTDGNPFVLAAPPLRIGFGVSLGFALLLLAAYRFDERASRLPLVRFWAWLGGFSYSLYLVHPLAIGAVLHAARFCNVPARALDLCLVAEVGVSLLFARILFVCCERPFLAWSKPKPVPPKASPHCA